MPNNEMVYKEPTQFQELLAEVIRELDGNHLKVKSGEAIQLLTVSEDGWPPSVLL